MKIRIGVGLGAGGASDSATFAGAVQCMERLGFDSLWLSEVLTGAVVDPLAGLADSGRLVIVATHDDRLIPLADQIVNLTSAAVNDNTWTPAPVGTSCFGRAPRARRKNTAIAAPAERPAT